MTMCFFVLRQQREKQTLVKKTSVYGYVICVVWVMQLLENNQLQGIILDLGCIIILEIQV